MKHSFRQTARRALLAWRTLALGALALGATEAHALPAIRNLNVSWQVSGTTPICGSERMTFSYGDNPGNDRRWGVQVRRHPSFVNLTTVRDASVIPASESFQSGVFGGPLISGMETTFEVRTYDDTGRLGERAYWTGTLPSCQGHAADGKGHVYNTFVLATFRDFAHLIPFTPDEFHNNVLVATTTAGTKISLSDYLAINSSNRIDSSDTVYPWVTIDYMSSYCSKQIYQPKYRNLTLGYSCDLGRIETDARTALHNINNIVPRGTVVHFVINGMGASGFSGTGGPTKLGADTLLYASKQWAYNPYDNIVHEMGHSLGFGHANSIYRCRNGIAPSTFMGGASGVDCQIGRYGVSVMGGGYLYQGFSAAQRRKRDLLPTSAWNVLLRFPNSMSDHTVTLTDLDTVSGTPGVKLAEFLSELWFDGLLPKQYRLFMEYSKAGAPLAFKQTPTSAGVRVGLLHIPVPGMDPSLGLGGDGEVYYLEDVLLNKVSDRIEIRALDLELEVTQKTTEDSIELFVGKISQSCRNGTPQISIAGATGSGTQAITIKRNSTLTLDVSNYDSECKPATFQVLLNANAAAGIPSPVVINSRIPATAKAATIAFPTQFGNLGTHTVTFQIKHDGNAKYEAQRTVNVTVVK